MKKKSRSSIGSVILSGHNEVNNFRPHQHLGDFCSKIFSCFLPYSKHRSRKIQKRTNYLLAPISYFDFIYNVKLGFDISVTFFLSRPTLAREKRNECIPYGGYRLCICCQTLCPQLISEIHLSLYRPFMEIVMNGTLER